MQIRGEHDKKASLSDEQSKCKYYSLCRHRRTELPCTVSEVAERYCKIYKLFHNIEVRDNGHALTA
ncbi:MAG TPA: hypothetical protein VJL54_04820 [Nitrososphaera sp.]|nr:hypothetical protein [Nitrososphaera sp.]